MTANKEIGIDDIFIVHGLKGYEEREQKLTNLLEKRFGLDFEFVTESASVEVNNTLIGQYFVPNIRDVLSSGPLFCTLVHILCYEKMVARQSKYALIFENDVCFIGDFLSKIKGVIEEARDLPEGFIISLENSTLRFPSIRVTRKGKFLYPASSGRCAGAYLIDLTAAQSILKELAANRCGKVIDWWHNDLIDKGILKMYWAHPALTEQGSFNGQLQSSISSRPAGIIRSFRWKVHKFYKMYILRVLKF